MRPCGALWLLPCLLLGLLSCTARTPPRVLHAPLPEAGPPPSTSPLEAPLPPPVTENETFVTIDGVPRYKIGLGDVLAVSLTKGFVEEKREVEVKASGRVAIDFRDAKVAGLTVEQAAEEIRQTLSPFYRQVSVDVRVREYNSKKVTVLGALGGAAGGGTILTLKGRKPLLEAIAESGGPAATADLAQIRIVRPDDTPVTVNMYRLLEVPMAQTIVVDAGQVIFIPARAPQVERRIFVLGQVRSPGPYPLAPDMHLSQALGLAGGPTDLAVLDSARIIRVGSNPGQIIEVDFNRVLEEADLTQDLPLQVNDLIYIPRERIGDWNVFLSKIRPSLEVLTYPLALPVQIKVLTGSFGGG